MEDKMAISDKNINNFTNIDLFTNTGIILFYNAQEKMSLFIKCSRISDKRSIETEVADALNSFLNFDYKESEIEAINNILLNNAKAANIISKVDMPIIEKLKSANVKGFELLGIKDNIDIRELKNLYRDASKKYHPDRGGDVEKMQIINDAFSLFFDILNNYITVITNDNVTMDKFNQWAETIFSAHLTLALIYADMYAFDKIDNHLNEAYSIAKDEKIQCKIIMEYNFGAFVTPMINRPCVIYGMLNMKTELKETAKSLSNLIDLFVSTNKALSKNFPKRSMFPKTNDFMYYDQQPLAIYTLQQAENLYRLGKIDKKRYGEIVRRFNKRSIEEVDYVEKINQFIEKFGFILNLSNSPMEKTDTAEKVIHPVGWTTTRFFLLSNGQKNEYIDVFSKKNMGNLFGKYYKIRLNEILLGIIKNFNNIDISRLRQEIDYFYKNLNEKYDGYSLLKSFLEFVCALTPTEREERFKILESMDFIFFDRASFENNPNKGKRDIWCSAEYITFAKQDIKDIIDYKENKSMTEWEVFRKIMHEIDNSDISKEHNRVWLEMCRPEPQLVVNSTEPYINLLLEKAKELPSTIRGHLQVGYSINRLTGAYVRLKNWEKVVYWGKLFFNLPEEYKTRSSKSEILDIKKRTERAELLWKREGN